jgi:hypothetical protein
VLELIFDRRAPAVFGRYWRRVKVVPATEICELAESIQPLTPEEEESLYRADAYVMGVRKSDGREIIGVVEVSWMVDIGDVERAQRRAEVLTSAGCLLCPSWRAARRPKPPSKPPSRVSALSCSTGFSSTPARLANLLKRNRHPPHPLACVSECAVTGSLARRGVRPRGLTGFGVGVGNGSPVVRATP